jgi:hypothetical protein
MTALKAKQKYTGQNRGHAQTINIKHNINYRTSSINLTAEQDIARSFYFAKEPRENKCQSQNSL